MTVCLFILMEGMLIYYNNKFLQKDILSTQIIYYNINSFLISTCMKHDIDIIHHVFTHIFLSTYPKIYFRFIFHISGPIRRYHILAQGNVIK